MEGGIKDESKKESPLGQIDPECIREALKTFFKPAKANDPQVDFYTIYKKEANEYDTDYIKKYEEDLTTTLLFAGLFSAVNSVFVIDVYSKLQPNPNAQSTALLHAILLTLNHSAIPDETFLVSTTQKDYPPEIVTATCLLYASLLLSLLAAFGAMLGKQWLDRYFRHAGGSMIERSGDRQRKCDGLIEGKFHFFIEALPVMLQIALLFLVCGLYTYMASINTSTAFTLITLVGLGALFYLVVLIAGTVWNDCPFQTPASDLLRFVGKKLRPHFVTLWRTIWPKRYRNWIRIPQLGQNAPHHRHQGPDQLTIREDLRLHSSWFTPDRLKTFRLNNANNARCVSWILRYITDPEARDAAIRLAGIIWWFEDGIKVKPLYKSIVSTFRTCFGSNMELFPKMRDRAYYSGQAILWIYTLAVCKSMEDMFPLPTSNYTTPESDPDLTQLLSVFQRKGHRLVTKALLHVDEAYTPLHSQWISRILLHLSWPSHAVTLARFDHPDLFKLHLRNVKPSTPLDAVFNRLLMCCNLLGTTVGDEVLKIEDKSDRMTQVLAHVSKTIVSALDNPHLQLPHIQEVLYILTKLETSSQELTEVAYGLCTVIWKNRHNPMWEPLLLLSLEAGFRNVRSLDSWTSCKLTRTEFHREWTEKILNHNNVDSEAITDLAYVTYMVEGRRRALRICTKFIDEKAGPFTPRLRKLFSACVEFSGCGVFKIVGGEKRFVELLSSLPIVIEDLIFPSQTTEWTAILLTIIKSPMDFGPLAIQFWELLAELATSGTSDCAEEYDSGVTEYLVRGTEWDKLECWMGFFWMACFPGPVDMATDFDFVMTTLFVERPGADKKLDHWMGEWSKKCGEGVPKSYTQTRDRALGRLKRPTSPRNEGTSHSLPAIRMSLPGDATSAEVVCSLTFSVSRPHTPLQAGEGGEGSGG